MKKKALLAASLALALTVTPLSGMNVSVEAAEAASVSGGDIGTTSGSEKQVINAPRDAQFTDDLKLCKFTYPVKPDIYGRLSMHIWVYRDDVLFKEYNARNDNACAGSINIQEGSSGDYDARFPFYQDLTDSGTYYFKVRLEQSRSSLGYLAVSETITSPSIEYTRPEQALGTTMGYWDSEKVGLFHYTAVKDAGGYEFRLYKQDEDSGEWKPCILKSSFDVIIMPGHLSALTPISSSDSPRDAGGEDKTRDFTNVIYNNAPYNLPAGRYAVTVKALSYNPNEIANGIEGEMSAVLEIGGNSNSNNSDDSDDSDDSGQTGNSILSENVIASAKPGEVVKITKEQNISCLSNADMKLLLESDVTLEMEYTYNGVDYKIRIPAGTAINNDIPWYGPLYLAQHYGVEVSYISQTDDTIVIVRKGDTLSKIARANGMTLYELKLKNPQIKDVDRIVPGQNIMVK